MACGLKLYRSRGSTAVVATYTVCPIGTPPSSSCISSICTEKLCPSATSASAVARTSTYSVSESSPSAVLSAVFTTVPIMKSCTWPHTTVGDAVLPVRVGPAVSDDGALVDGAVLDVGVADGAPVLGAHVWPVPVGELEAGDADGDTVVGTAVGDLEPVGASDGDVLGDPVASVGDVEVGEEEGPSQ